MTSEQLAVRLVSGEDASGFAAMLADVLEGNVSDYRGRAWVAARARGAVVLRASDRDVAVTLVFGPDGIDIEDGDQPGVPMLAGPWLTMAGLCSGSVSPMRAIATRELHLRPTARLGTLAAAGYVLSVPSTYYEHSGGGAARAVLCLAAAGLVVVAGAWLISRRRRASGIRSGQAHDA